jgi:hypothetical protein
VVERESRIKLSASFDLFLPNKIKSLSNVTERFWHFKQTLSNTGAVVEVKRSQPLVFSVAATLSKAPWCAFLGHHGLML